MHASSSEFRVRYSETDQMGVVYHTNYLVWCEIGRTDFIRASGLTFAELERRGVLLAVSEATIRYHAAARYDDLIRVETTLAAVRSRAVTFDYVITNAATGERLASAHTALVSLDVNGRPTTLPDDFRRQLERQQKRLPDRSSSLDP
jgi:acyl-CoA thioester hydrolase